MSSTDVHLVLVRHATAADLAVSGRDEDRPLTDEGLRQAERLAAAARALGVPAPGLVVSSGYLRAEQTLAAFDWFVCEEHKDLCVSPFGNIRDAKRLLQSRMGSGARVLWVFSHNPFLTSLLEALAPEAFAGVRRFRKSELVWLRWAQESDALERRTQLRAYLPKPTIGG